MTWRGAPACWKKGPSTTCQCCRWMVGADGQAGGRRSTVAVVMACCTPWPSAPAACLGVCEQVACVAAVPSYHANPACSQACRPGAVPRQHAAAAAHLPRRPSAGAAGAVGAAAAVPPHSRRLLHPLLLHAPAHAAAVGGVASAAAVLLHPALHAASCGPWPGRHSSLPSWRSQATGRDAVPLPPARCRRVGCVAEIRKMGGGGINLLAKGVWCGQGRRKC